MGVSDRVGVAKGVGVDDGRVVGEVVGVRVGVGVRDGSVADVGVGVSAGGVGVSIVVVVVGRLQ